MKILLLGEFSALHKNLKEGLQELGHEAIVAAYGDGFKKIPVDISFDSLFPSVIGKLHRKIRPLLVLNKLQDFDVVQLVNPFLFYKYFPRSYFYNYLIKNNEKFFILAAGDDAYFWRFGRYKLKYAPFNDFLKFDTKASSCYLESDKAFEFNETLVKNSRGVIPIMYEYDISYAGVSNRLPIIPIPINTNKVQYTPNIVRKKLVVFHGLNRYGFKGTRHVEEAFDILKEKHPNDLDLIIEGTMPLNEYLNLMARTNVVVDQMYSHSCGVNAIYALAMGKVVLGGSEPESLRALGVNTSPVINIKPNAQSIVDQVEHLLDIRPVFESLGYESRIFAEEVHGHIKVAKKYVKTWKNN